MPPRPMPAKHHLEFVAVPDVLLVDPFVDAVAVVLVFVEDPLVPLAPLETTITTMPSLALYCLMTVPLATVEEAS